MSFLYIGASVAYFVVVPQASINPGSSIIAAQFFSDSLGSVMGKSVLPCMIALSAFGSTMCCTFSSCRVILETANSGYYPASLKSLLGYVNPEGGLVGGLLLHGFITLLLILLPPPGAAYEFLINVTAYPEYVFYCICVIGLLYMRVTKPNVLRPVQSSLLTNAVFIFVCMAVCVFPFFPPEVIKEDELPYYLYGTVAWGFMIATGVWWYAQIGSNVALEAQMTIFDKAALDSCDDAGPEDNSTDGILEKKGSHRSITSPSPGSCDYTPRTAILSKAV